LGIKRVENQGKVYDLVILIKSHGPVIPLAKISSKSAQSNKFSEEVEKWGVASWTRKVQ
jgi:hypothetical protein